MRNRKKKEPVAFEVIEAAVAGDVVAIRDGCSFVPTKIKAG